MVSWIRRLGTWGLLLVVAVVGIVAGVAIGAAANPAQTETDVLTKTVRTTHTVVKRKVVRKPPITVRETVTVNVPKGGDNALDYGIHGDAFEVRGLQAYRPGDYEPGKIPRQVRVRLRM